MISMLAWNDLKQEQAEYEIVFGPQDVVPY